MTQKINRREILKMATAMAAASAVSQKAQAQDKPPLRIIVPLPAGGVADASVRIFAESWTSLTKQAVVVDNRPGGSFLIGMQTLLSAPADGNTWIHLNNGMSAAQATFGRYDLTKQITPIGLMGSTPGTIFVNANSPIQNAKDLLDWIKANPGKLNYGTVLGGVEHMMTAGILKRYGLTGTLVPFKGGPDACTALAQGEVHMVLSALPLIVPFKGRIKPIVVLTEQRAAMLPEVPTFKEAGLEMPGLNYYGAFAVHSATPKAVIEAHYKNAAETLKNPTVISKFQQQGMFAHAAPSDVMVKAISDELKWMAPIAAELNLKAG
jgi:tripartite-type tricarboxylate transporter receptor subunit TctC